MPPAATVAQTLWEQLATFLLDLSRAPEDETII